MFVFVDAASLMANAVARTLLPTVLVVPEGRRGNCMPIRSVPEPDTREDGLINCCFTFCSRRVMPLVGSWHHL